MYFLSVFASFKFVAMNVVDVICQRAVYIK